MTALGIEHSYKIWQALAAAAGPSKPPYPAAMRTSPLSCFKDDVWEFPPSWTPVNARNRRIIRFLSPIPLKDGCRIGLLPSSDRVLINQFKEALWASMHRRSVLSTERKHQLKVTGIHSLAADMRRIFVSLKVAGCSSLASLDNDQLGAALSSLTTTRSTYNDLIITFQIICDLSRHALIQNGLQNIDQFEITQLHSDLQDESGENGWQPIEDATASKLILSSLRYLPACEYICGVISKYIHKPFSKVKSSDLDGISSRIGIHDPELTAASLISLAHIAAANLILFHLGLRASELTAVKSDFIRTSNDGCSLDVTRLTFTQIKYAPNENGLSRDIRVHPLLLEVQDLLSSINRAAGIKSDYVFIHFRRKLPYLTNSLNAAFARFCVSHSVGSSVTSHQWRKTVAGITVRVLTGASLHLKELFNHSDLSAISHYTMASPFIREEIRDLSLDVYRKRGASLLESLTVFGGPGLGGKQGHQLEEQFSLIFSGLDVTEYDLSKTLDEFVDDMISQGIFPTVVMPGVLCMKAAHSRGACSSYSGDRLPDAERCTANCTYQVQESHRKETVSWLIQKCSRDRGRWSVMQERFWAAQCASQLNAWPQLRRDLAEFIENWPMLKELVP